MAFGKQIFVLITHSLLCYIFRPDGQATQRLSTKDIKYPSGFLARKRGITWINDRSTSLTFVNVLHRKRATSQEFLQCFNYLRHRVNDNNQALSLCRTC